MRLRDQVALTLPSFILRLALGITFLWAGTGKLVGVASVSGDDAARLANMGVVITAAPAAPAAADPNAPALDSTPSMPLDPLPGADPQPAQTPPAQNPQGTRSQPQTQIQPQPQSQTQSQATDAPAENPPQGSPAPGSPGIESGDRPEPESVKQSLGGPSGARSALRLVQYTGVTHAASDFPEPVSVKRVYLIALMISKAADPGLTADSTPIDPIVPASLASGPWPKGLAWAAAITEVSCGALLVLGLLTRVSALGTLSVMLAAMWMTQMGPAVIHSTDAILGFIPNNQPWYAPESYSTLLWQLALAAMSLAVFFLGSGALGVDRLLFKPTYRDPYIHGDPKAARPGKASNGKSASDRSEFDRTPNPTP